MTFYILAFAIGTLGTARITKLLVEDQFPPTAKLRNAWVKTFTNRDSDWVELFLCGFCMSVWVAGANIAVAYFSDFHTVWWVLNGWLAAAYLSGIIIARDVPNPE